MENTIFYLSTCSTCTRILKELKPNKTYRLQDIKTNNITAKQLDEIAKVAGSYETLFSRRAMKFRSMGLHEKKLSEKDYRKLILDEYTFLRRPVIVSNGEVFIGNAKSTVEAAKKAMKK